MPPSGLTLIPLTTYLQAQDAEKLRALAADADRTVAAEIRQAIRHYVKTQAAKDGVDGAPE